MRLTLLLSLFVTTVLAQSQLGTGAISGTVQDATGAAVPDAQITITQSETGLVRTMKSSAAGQFLAAVLPTGAYRVRIAKTGFATQEQDGLVVNVGANGQYRHRAGCRRCRPDGHGERRVEHRSGRDRYVQPGGPQGDQRPAD